MPVFEQTFKKQLKNFYLFQLFSIQIRWSKNNNHFHVNFHKNIVNVKDEAAFTSCILWVCKTEAIWFFLLFSYFFLSFFLTFENEKLWLELFKHLIFMWKRENFHFYAKSHNRNTSLVYQLNHEYLNAIFQIHHCSFSVNRWSFAILYSIHREGAKKKFIFCLLLRWKFPILKPKHTWLCSSWEWCNIYDGNSQTSKMYDQRYEFVIRESINRYRIVKTETKITMQDWAYWKIET